MSRYEARLERDLSNLKEKLASLTQSVEEALTDAVSALLMGDDDLAYNVILSDLPINRASRELDRLCHSFIAVHLPAAGHLRFVSSVMRVNLEQERIGDYASTICRESVQLERRPTGDLARDVEAIASQSQRMLARANETFGSDDADRARATMGMADQAGRSFHAAFERLVASGKQLSSKDLLAYLVILRSLLRVAHQAKNVCEEATFAATGQPKAPKVYHILFLDEDNAILGPMAQAIARKGFPGSGEYDSAGRQAAAALDNRLVGFLSERAMDPGDLTPTTLSLSEEELAGYHVIVSLQGSVKSYVDRVPFHTVALEWPVGTPPTGDGDEYEAIYREIAVRVSDLIKTLRGDEAP